MNLNEAQTRRRIIDKSLALAGWDVGDAAQVTQELDIDLRGTDAAPATPPGHSATADNHFAGHQFVDYAKRGPPDEDCQLDPWVDQYDG